MLRKIIVEKDSVIEGIELKKGQEIFVEEYNADFNVKELQDIYNWATREYHYGRPYSGVYTIYKDWYDNVMNNDGITKDALRDLAVRVKPYYKESKEMKEDAFKDLEKNGIITRKIKYNGKDVKEIIQKNKDGDYERWLQSFDKKWNVKLNAYLTDDEVKTILSKKSESIIKENEKNKLKESINWNKFSDGQLRKILDYFNIPVKSGERRSLMISDLQFIEKDTKLQDKDLKSVIKSIEKENPPFNDLNENKLREDEAQDKADILDQKQTINKLKGDLLQAQEDDDKDLIERLKKDLESETEALKSMQDRIKTNESKESDITLDIKKVMKKGSKKDYFSLTKNQIVDIAKKYKVDVEDIYQFGEKLPNGDWEFESLVTVVNGIKDNFREAKLKEDISSASKKLFTQYGKEIYRKLLKDYPELENKPDKYVVSSIEHVMMYMLSAFEDHPERKKFSKYFPDKYDKNLFKDYSDGEHDSEWDQLYDAQRFNILKYYKESKEMKEEDEKFYYLSGNAGLKRNGSFSSNVHTWTTFTKDEKEKYEKEKIKPYRATRTGEFVKVKESKEIREASPKNIRFTINDYDKLLAFPYKFWGIKNGSKQEIYSEKTHNLVAKFDIFEEQLNVYDTEVKDWLKENKYVNFKESKITDLEKEVEKEMGDYYRSTPIKTLEHYLLTLETKLKNYKQLNKKIDEKDQATYNVMSKIFKDRKSLNEAKKEYELKGTNITVTGEGLDANGNQVVRFKYPNSSNMSIQTNGTLPETNRIIRRNFDKMDDKELALIKKEIVDYIQKYGSKNMKSGLKTYRSEAKQNELNESGVAKDGNLSDKEIVNLINETLKLDKAKLKRNRDLVDQQIDIAIKKNNKNALLNLAVMEEIYRIAFDMKEFGDTEVEDYIDNVRSVIKQYK